MSHPTAAGRVARRLTLSAVVLAAVAAPAMAQLGAGVRTSGRLEATSNNSTALTEFTLGNADIANGANLKAVRHFTNAIQADPSLGIARVYAAFMSPTMSRETKRTEIERGVADAATGSPAEALVAQSIRARFNNQMAAARDLLHGAVAITPDDPSVNAQYVYVSGLVPDIGVGGSIIPAREMIARIPDHPAGYTLLAYGYYLTGNRAGALEAIRNAVTRGNDQPNVHDAYGELLQWSGRYSEAITEYRTAITLDNEYLNAYFGLAEAATLAGQYSVARTALTDGISHVSDNAIARNNFRRAIAMTYILEGNERDALSSINTAISEASGDNAATTVGNLHIDGAVINALVGDGRSIATHMSAATGATAINRSYYSGIAYAIVRNNASARTALTELRSAIGTNANANTNTNTNANTNANTNTSTNTTANRNMVATLNALIMVNEGKGNEAIAEITKTDLTTPLSKAVMALAQQQVGNTVTARSLRDEVLSDRMLSLTNGNIVTARKLVQRIN